MRLILISVACVLVLCLFAGCAGYQLGPVNGAVAGGKSIEVLPFNNQTLQPRLGDALTQALREELQTDGTFHLTAHDPGDVVVTGVVTSYSRSGVSFLSTDASTPQDYRVDVIAHVTARERASGRLLIDKNVTGQTLVPVTSDLADAERQALPLLAQDLARNITGLLTEGAW
jgi:hypothetical protein